MDGLTGVLGSRSSSHTHDLFTRSTLIFFFVSICFTPSGDDKIHSSFSSTVHFPFHSSASPSGSSQQQSSALTDALRCMNSLHLNDADYVHPLDQQAAHMREINDNIAKLLPSNLPVNTVDCYGLFSGPWLEDLWVGLRQNNASDFGHFIPIFVPWNRLWLIDYLDPIPTLYWTTIRNIFALFSPHYLYVTVSQKRWD
jgi:hypothetical protein